MKRLAINGTAGVPPAMSAKRERIFVKDPEGLLEKRQDCGVATTAGGTPAVPVTDGLDIGEVKEC